MPRLSFGEYILGTANFLALVALLGLASTAVVRDRLAYLTGVDRVLATATLLTAGMILVHVVPLSLTVLSRGSVLAAAIVVTTAALLFARAGRSDAPVAARPVSRGAPGESRALRIAVGLLMLYVAAVMVAYVTTVFDRPVTFVDFMEFHGPIFAEWLQDGSLWSVLQIYPLHIQGYTPGNGEVLMLALVLPWRSDFLVRFVEVPFVVVTALAVVSLAQHLRVRSSIAALYGLLLVALPVVGLLALETAKPDTLLFAAFGVAAVFLLRHVRDGRLGDLMIAGASCGIAFGTKWNGLTTIAVLVSFWAIGRLMGGAGVRRAARELAVLGALVMLLGGIWYARNAAETGNPLFPQGVELGGLTVFPTPNDFERERIGPSLSEYLTDYHAMRTHILPPIFRSMIGYGGVLLVVLFIAAAGAALSARRARDRTRTEVLLLSGAGLAIGVAYVFTPYTAQIEDGVPRYAFVTVRFAVPALLLGAACAAWLTERSPRTRPFVTLMLVAGAVEATRRSFLDAPHYVSEWRTAAAFAALVAGAVAGLLLVRWLRRLSAPRRRSAQAMALAAIVAVATVGGYVDQRRFHEDRYADFDPVLAWVKEHAPRDRRIGLARVWPFTFYSPPLAMYGPRFENTVKFIGSVRGGILEEHSDAREFQRAVEREDFDFVLLQNPPADGASSEERWLRPLGYAPVARSEILLLLARRSG